MPPLPGCECPCHNWLRGTERACRQKDHIMTAIKWGRRAIAWDEIAGGVDRGDVLEAVLACQVCINLHCPSLSGRPYPIAPRIVKRFVREQADGWTDPEPPSSE